LEEHTQGYKLSRKEIIDKYRWREGLIPLSLSKHAKRRVEERVDGEFPIVPTMVRITEKNICSGRSDNGKKLSSVKIRLDYKNDKWMYLVICPNSGVVKTLYINYKDAKKNAFTKGQVIETCCEEGDTNTGETSFKDVGILSEFVAEAPRKETLLELWVCYIWRELLSLLGPSTRKRTGEV